VLTRIALALLIAGLIGMALYQHDVIVESRHAIRAAECAVTGMSGRVDEVIACQRAQGWALSIDMDDHDKIAALERSVIVLESTMAKHLRKGGAK
jgi:hypothetical protein